MKKVFTLLLFVQLISAAEAQTKKSGSPPVVRAPRATITRISSPNKKWTLVFECPDYTKPRKLWIEHNGTHERRLVEDYERSASIGWAPDSQLFFVDDELGSNETLAYVYDPVTLKETDLAQAVLAADRSADEYLRAGHSYLEAKRWTTSHQLLVTLWGHFDGERRGFALHYRIDINGSVQRLSKREY